MKIKQHIYELTNPIDEKEKYIGQTRDIKSRYQNHIYSCNNDKSPRGKWIKKLKRMGLKPKLRILKTVMRKNADKTEKDYIDSYRNQEGIKLKNTTLGGSGNISSSKEKKITFTNKIDKNILSEFKSIVKRRKKTNGEVIREFMEDYIMKSHKVEAVNQAFIHQAKEVAKEFYRPKIKDDKPPVKEFSGELKKGDTVFIADHKFMVLAIYDYCEENKRKVQDSVSGFGGVKNSYGELEVPIINWKDRNSKLENGNMRYWIKILHSETDMISKMQFNSDVIPWEAGYIEDRDGILNK